MNHTASETPSWNQIREAHPAALGCAYLNTASRGLLRQSAVDAGASYYQVLHDDPSAGFSSYWEPHLERARESVARLIGARSSQIAFVANASAGLNLAAELIGESGAVIAHDEEFPSVTLPWEQRGHRLDFVTPGADGVVRVEDYARAVTDDTRYIAVSAVQYASGYRVDLTGLRALCDERNLYLVVDATQAVGAVPVDVGEFRPDCLTFSSYKWLCAGYGVATFYVSEALLESRSLPVVGWRSARDAHGLANRSAHITTDAMGFEMGNPILPGPLVLGASAEALASIGVARIRERVEALTTRLHAGLDTLGVTIRSPRAAQSRGPISMLEVGDPAGVEQRFCAAGIHTSTRAGRIRVSPHFYNNEADIDALLDALS